MRQLIVAEHDNLELKNSALTTITAAQQLGATIDVLVVGYHCEAVAQQAAKVVGVANVILIQSQAYQYFLAENIAALIVELASDYNYILAPATTFGKNIMPRVAALLDVAQYSDIVSVIDPQTFIRPIYAGNALMTFKALDAVKILTIRATAFPAAHVRPENEPAAKIESRQIEINLGLAEFQEREVTLTSRPELTAARVVVSGGRGLQSGDNFHLIEKLADRLNGAVGASRAAVDAGFVPNDCQVGQTGKVVAPDLYIAVGISGAIQHLAGMKDSKVIVAINKDAEAPIFQLATYGVVGDLFQIVPELIAELDKAKSGK